jgi:hypothetical protein
MASFVAALGALFSLILAPAPRVLITRNLGGHRVSDDAY